MDFKKIKKPTLILDESKCRANIRMMAAKARSSGAIFRPHFKTHQTIEIGEWFRDEGVNSITVSSITMAKHFAGAGWKDITIAFPLNLREIDDAEKLTESINLNILITSFEQALFLRKRPKLKAGYFIEINTGYNRSGLDWDDHVQIMNIKDEIGHNASLRFIGFLTHSGHSYRADSIDYITNLYKDTLAKCTSLRALSPDKILLSAGDTPSCTLIGDFKGFDEVRPGNFVFYDLSLKFLGVCSFEQLALTVACPVVEKNMKRKEIIVYGGGVHLSKESLKTSEGQIIFGKAVVYNETGWISLSDKDYLRMLAQEHGIISSSEELFNSVNVGDLVGIIPVHAKWPADLLRVYHTFNNKILSGFSPK